jgi:ABC-type uncharacterized transport system permease subunit
MIVAGLTFLIVLEIFYITLGGEFFFLSFRDFMDAVVLLTFIASVYFVFQYLRATESATKWGYKTNEVSA